MIYMFKFLLCTHREGHEPSSEKYPRTLCAKFGWHGPSGSGEGDFFFVVNNIIISLFFYYFPLETPNPLHQLHPISCLAKKHSNN